MSWVDHAVWWHVYPLGFTGAFPPGPPDEAAGPGLRQLIDWLDYARDLGASGLALGPIFHSTSHGYDTLDHFAIDPRLGGLDDFDALVEACRGKGLRLMLDGVFNHVSRDHPWLRRALAEGPQGEYARFFALDWHGDRPQPNVFEGHDQLVALNHRSPAAAAFVRSVMEFWLDRGADAWRLDAAYAVPPSFWRATVPPVRRTHPGAWFVGEVIHGDYVSFVRRAGLDSVTQYELWKSAWSSLADRNFFELDWTLGRHNHFLDAFTPMTFIGNHDVTRIASAVGLDHVVLALTVLATVGGVPSVYYGDEQGLQATKQERAGGDDAIRPRFPARPGDLPVTAPWLYRAHQDLIGLRRRHPWLVGARTERIELTTTRYVYASRGEGGELTVELDVGAVAQAEIREGGTPLYRWPA